MPVGDNQSQLEQDQNKGPGTGGQKPGIFPGRKALSPFPHKSQQCLSGGAEPKGHKTSGRDAEDL